MECRHPSYLMWSHNPQFPGSKPDSCLLPCDVWPDIMLMPDALDPFHHPSSASNACMSAWNFSCHLLFLSMYSPEFKLWRYLVPYFLGLPRLIDLVPIRPLKFALLTYL